MLEDLYLRSKALMHFRFNIGKRPKINYWLQEHIDNIHTVSACGRVRTVLDNIVYIGGPEHIVRFHFRRTEYNTGKPNSMRRYYDDISLTLLDHYSICVLFKFAYDNRALVESHDGFETNMTLVGEPLEGTSSNTYPHPFLIKVKHPSGSCYVKPVKYKLFQIDII